MKLRQQVIGLGVVGVLMAGLVGGIGLYVSGRLADAIEQSVAMGSALKSSQEADMMHDAVRADVLFALLGAHNRDAAQIAEARQGLKEHAKTFQEALTSLQRLPLSEEVKTIVARTLPQVATYTDAAAKIQALADGDGAAAQAQLPAFQKAFSALEQQMSDQADAIEKNGQDVQTAARDSVATARLQVISVLVLAAVLLLSAALWLARQPRAT